MGFKSRLAKLWNLRRREKNKKKKRWFLMYLQYAKDSSNRHLKLLISNILHVVTRISQHAEQENTSEQRVTVVRCLDLKQTTWELLVYYYITSLARLRPSINMHTSKQEPLPLGCTSHTVATNATLASASSSASDIGTFWTGTRVAATVLPARAPLVFYAGIILPASRCTPARYLSLRQNVKYHRDISRRTLQE